MDDEGLVVSGITRFSTGFPVTLYNNNDTSLLGTIPNGINNNGVDTPNVAPGNLEVNTNPRNGSLPLIPRFSVFRRWANRHRARGASSTGPASAISIWRFKRMYGCPSPDR